MASVVISGDTSGSVTLSAPTVAGSTTQTLQAVAGTVALTRDVIGVGQTWQTVSRTRGTEYINDTGRPIMIAVSTTQVSAGTATFTVGGVQIYNFNASDVGEGGVYSAVIPAGATYTIGGTATIRSVSELR